MSKCRSGLWASKCSKARWKYQFCGFHFWMPAAFKLNSPLWILIAMSWHLPLCHGSHPFAPKLKRNLLQTVSCVCGHSNGVGVGEGVSPTFSRMWGYFPPPSRETRWRAARAMEAGAISRHCQRDCDSMLLPERVVNHCIKTILNHTSENRILNPVFLYRVTNENFLNKMQV